MANINILKYDFQMHLKFLKVIVWVKYALFRKKKWFGGRCEHAWWCWITLCVQYVTNSSELKIHMYENETKDRIMNIQRQENMFIISVLYNFNNTNTSVNPSLILWY